MGPRVWALINGVSVSTDVQEVRDLVGTCFEPTPSGSPVLVVSGPVGPVTGVPETTMIYSYPDHAAELFQVLRLAAVREPDGSSLGTSPSLACLDSTEDSVPDSITATQIRLWLARNGISIQAVDDAVASLNDEEARIQWEYSPYIERSNPLVAMIGSMLGMTSEQIDQAFREAA